MTPRSTRVLATLLVGLSAVGLGGCSSDRPRDEVTVGDFTYEVVGAAYDEDKSTVSYAGDDQDVVVLTIKITSGRGVEEFAQDERREAYRQERAMARPLGGGFLTGVAKDYPAGGGLIGLTPPPAGESGVVELSYIVSPDEKLTTLALSNGKIFREDYKYLAIPELTGTSVAAAD